jgi:hypothetical protein
LPRAARAHPRFLARSIPELRHPGIFLRRELAAQEYLSAALPLSYSNLRHWQESNLRPPDPDVTRAFTTPPTLEIFASLLTSFYFFLRAHP